MKQAKSSIKTSGKRNADTSFAQFPIGTSVMFRGGHAHARESGIIIAYEALRLFPYLGEVPKILLQDKSECFATKPQDLRKILPETSNL